MSNPLDQLLEGLVNKYEARNLAEAEHLACEENVLKPDVSNSERDAYLDAGLKFYDTQSEWSDAIHNAFPTILSAIRQLQAEPAVIRQELGSKNQLWRRDWCEKLLVALAGAKCVTPEETFGDNLDWAISDTINAIRKLAEAIRQDKERIAELLDALRQADGEWFGDCNCDRMPDKRTCHYCDTIAKVRAALAQEQPTTPPTPSQQE